MKFTSVLFLSLFCLQAFAVDSAKIKTTFIEIKKYAFGGDTHTKLKGKTAKDMVISLAMKVEELETADEVTFEASGDKSPSPEDTIWGTMSMRAALDLVDYASEEDQGNLSKKQGYKIKTLIRNLIGTGVQFGYSPSTGGVQCGVVFPGLLLIDTDKKVIYDLSMFGSGC